MIQNDAELLSAQNLSPLNESIQKMAEKSFIEANPEGFSKKDFKPNDYKWDMALKTCGKFFFTQEIHFVQPLLIN